MGSLKLCFCQGSFGQMHGPKEAAQIVEAILLESIDPQNCRALAWIAHPGPMRDDPDPSAPCLSIRHLRLLAMRVAVYKLFNLIRKAYLELFVAWYFRMAQLRNGNEAVLRTMCVPGAYCINIIISPAGVNDFRMRCRNKTPLGKDLDCRNLYSVPKNCLCAPRCA